ncbi:urea transporter [Tricholoma matsutake]|nr:urea transporter [Tricholoma matsutake 945]
MSGPILPQGVGYGVVVGVGLFFSALMIGITSLQGRYTSFSPKSAEEFNSASRSIKPGLIAAGIVSAWTTAATFLQSSAVAYKYGISGPWWYGSGSTVQVLLFAMLAARLKQIAPHAHTWLEIVDARWGKPAHLVFMFFGLATNIIDSSLMVIGGSVTVTALTGMNTVVACFLIPLGVALYVMIGGMRSTLLCDYTHATVLMIIILVFVFTVYAISPKIGSPFTMHRLLTEAAATYPISGNAQGSYMTMRSKNGLIFGVVNIIGNFGAVFQDQAYWQRAIASQPTTTVKGYLLGGVAWCSIPFTLATTLGLAAVAVRNDPSMGVLTPADVSAGLVAPTVVTALLGKPGAIALLIALFLAVTSACSAELIAVSSLMTYDVYKRYINPAATEAQILRVGHIMVVAYALVCGLAGVIWFYIGISLGWLFYFMGVILGSGVVPIALCTSWSKANKWGCIGGAVVGLAAGLIAWLVTTSTLNGGVINVITTGGDYEMLAGNIASICVGGIIATASSLLWPDNYDWESTRAINAPEPRKDVTDPSKISKEETSTNEKDPEYEAKDASSSQELSVIDDDLDPAALQKAVRFASISSIALFIVLAVAIPLPLFFASTVYNAPGFATWVSLGIAWVICALLMVILYPLVESRHALAQVSRGIIKDVFTKGSGKYVAPRHIAA